MRHLRLVAFGTVILFTALAAPSQQIEPAFHGFWTLNVEKSDFGGRAKPRTGLVNWGEHGWAIAIVQADGGVYADAVETGHGQRGASAKPRPTLPGQELPALQDWPH